MLPPRLPFNSNQPNWSKIGAWGFRAPWNIFWVSFLVRVVYLTIAHTYRFSAFPDHFHFGWEMGRIARSVALGQGYANPFGGHTGPTAWVPPLYPLLLAGVFKLFGIYSSLSAWVILTLNSLFSALTALAVYEIGVRCYNERVAKWSSWLWALHPAAMQYAVRWVWDISLTTFLFAWILVLSLRMRAVGESSKARKHTQSTANWLLFGLLWGLLALSNSTLLLFLPICGIWVVLGAQGKVTVLRNAILGLLVCSACIGIWTLRNWEAFHAFVPMRSNLGAEMWAWNKPGSNGIALGAPIEPFARDPRYMAYAAMGELRYSKDQGLLAKSYIQTHPREFALLSVKRLYFYWVSVPHPIDNKPWTEGFRVVNFCFLSLAGLMGLALSMRNRVPGANLFAWAFLLLPLTYYFVSIQARFRHPLEPLIALFAVYLFQSAGPAQTASKVRI
jgi:4-amino-4-deoxy-L-arabinose transferase-like glycosyltransferase